MALIADDIVFGPGVDRADGDDRRFGRFDFAGDNGLEAEDQFRGLGDGVDGGFGGSAVASFASDDDIDAIDVGEQEAGS